MLYAGLIVGTCLLLGQCVAKPTKLSKRLGFDRPCTHCPSIERLSRPAYGFDFAPTQHSAAVRYPNGTVASVLTIEADEEWQVLMHKYLNMSMSEMIDKRDERLDACATETHRWYIMIPAWLPNSLIPWYRRIFPRATFSTRTRREYTKYARTWFCCPCRAHDLGESSKFYTSFLCTRPAVAVLERVGRRLAAALATRGHPDALARFGYAIPDFVNGAPFFGASAADRFPELRGHFGGLAQDRAHPAARAHGVDVPPPETDRSWFQDCWLDAQNETVLALACDGVALQGTLEPMRGERVLGWGSIGDHFADAALACPEGAGGTVFAQHWERAAVRIAGFVTATMERWEQLARRLPEQPPHPRDEYHRRPIGRVVLLDAVTADPAFRDAVERALPNSARSARWHAEEPEFAAARGLAELAGREDEMPPTWCVETAECKRLREDVRNANFREGPVQEGHVAL